MKVLLLILFTNYAFASVDIERISLQVLLAMVVVLIITLMLYTVVTTKKLKQKNIQIFNIKTNNDIVKEGFEKTLLPFDLQEVFLYFFKTLNYEASKNNNAFLVNQDMFYYEEGVAICPTRHYYGDYTNIIKAIWEVVSLIDDRVSNETILIDIKPKNITDGKTILFIDIGILGDYNDDEKIFEDIKNSKQLNTNKQKERLKEILQDAKGSMVYKDRSSREKCAVCLSFTLLNAEDICYFNVSSKESLKALIIHENSKISEVISDNLSSFNIKCIFNHSSLGLLDKIKDSVNCAYRLILIDANIFSDFSDENIRTLIKYQDEYCFRLIIILNNHKISSVIEKYAQFLDFLPIPYTVDSIRSIVNIAKVNQEKLQNG